MGGAEEHPLGVKPASNALILSSEEASRVLLGRFGLGRLAGVPEDVLLKVLGLLDVSDLARFSICSRLAYTFASADFLWKDLALGSWNPAEDFDFRGSWRLSVLHSDAKYTSDRGAIVLSDALFRPFHYGNLDPDSNWLKRQEIEVRDADEGFSVDDFVRDFEIPNRPVLIKNALRKSWKAYEAWGDKPLCSGRRPSLRVLEGENKPFRVGPVDMRLCDFLQYSELQSEEDPLYLFDCKFADRVNRLSTDYEVPIYFRNTETHPARDMFEAMGSERRPDYRWLIAGAARSGSKWHVDPNGTHAWNAIISGSKRWIMYPPNSPPPGVTPSDDGADVTQPVSLMEWYVQFYDKQCAPVEFTAEAGDLVFVPSRWWHCVLNLDACVAMTQNYISSSNLRSSLRLMRDRPHQVSGLAQGRSRKELYEEFRKALEKHHRGLLEAFDDDEAELERRKKARTVSRAPEDLAFSFSFF